MPSFGSSPPRGALYHTSPQARFSLLLLEEGEDYVSDWMGALEGAPDEMGPSSGGRPPAVMRGRVRLCTRSLFFEPDDLGQPITRVPLAAVSEMEPFSRGQGGAAAAMGGSQAQSQHGFVLRSTMVVLMREEGRDHPYAVRRGPGHPPSPLPPLTFRLDFATPESFLPPIQMHLAAAQLPPRDRDPLVALMGAEREARGDVFDPSRLVSYDETPLLDLSVRHVTPLVREPGRLVLTQERAYFFPLYGGGGEALTRSHPHTHLAAVAGRRVGLRETGLELFFLGGGERLSPSPSSPPVPPPPGPSWGGDLSALFEFKSPSDRDAVYDTLRGLSQTGAALSDPAAPASLRDAAAAVLSGEGPWTRHVTAAWAQGHVSNLDYLLFLNTLSGRTYNDLSQYPVVPWVVSDFVSDKLDLSDSRSFRDLAKPMGAQTPERLEFFKSRYKEALSIYVDQTRHERRLNPPPRNAPTEADSLHALPFDPHTLPFLYGVHYSNPAYCAYWMVRTSPGHVLKLQGGKFDDPDRCFASLPQCWESASGHRGDVKELVPEFYAGEGGFLANRLGLDLGHRQDGSPVGDVALPPWAEGTPEGFIRRHREAMESEYASSRLHLWIDLVFGFASRGPSALASDNVFHPLSYGGAVQWGGVEDPQERARLALQIEEFGQVPRELFDRPHPPRAALPPPGASWGLQGQGGRTPTAALLATLGAALEAVSSGGAPLAASESLGEYWGRAHQAPDQEPLIATFLPLDIALTLGEEPEPGPGLDLDRSLHVAQGQTPPATPPRGPGGQGQPLQGPSPPPPAGVRTAQTPPSGGNGGAAPAPSMGSRATAFFGKIKSGMASAGVGPGPAQASGSPSPPPPPGAPPAAQAPRQEPLDLITGGIRGLFGKPVGPAAASVQPGQPGSASSAAPRPSASAAITGGLGALASAIGRQLNQVGVGPGAAEGGSGSAGPAARPPWPPQPGFGGGSAGGPRGYRQGQAAQSPSPAVPVPAEAPPKQDQGAASEEGPPPPAASAVPAEADHPVETEAVVPEASDPTALEAPAVQADTGEGPGTEEVQAGEGATPPEGVSGEGSGAPAEASEEAATPEVQVAEAEGGVEAGSAEGKGPHDSTPGKKKKKNRGGLLAG